MGPLFNAIAMTETARRPALMFGISSDRIGTPDGQSYFFTLSKDLEESTGLPIAPYAGAAYGTFENDLRMIGGMLIRFGGGVSSTLIHDGKAFHPTLEVRFLDRHALSVLWVETDDLGIAYSVSF